MLFEIVWAVCEARFRFPSLGLKQLAVPRARDSAPSAEFGTPSRRGQRGPVRGCAPFTLMPNPVLRALGRHRRLRRRAVRHENQSLTARQSRDLLLISGRVDGANTPSGQGPSFHLCTPPGTPPCVFSLHKTARATRLCCGSFPHSLRSLR